MLMKRDKLGLTPMWPAVKAGLRSAAAFPSAFARFKKLRKNAFAARVKMRDGIGMTLTPSREHAETEVEYLRLLGTKLPVLLRFYHHDTEAEWHFVTNLAQQLHAEGYPVSGAFVQSRKAVTDPESWRRFLHFVFERVGDILVEAELGHAINRVKWGLWSPEEYAALLEPWSELHPKYPQIRLLGPAVNDFEFQHVVAALGEIPGTTRLDALSLHLYVDRRGAPENKQKLLGGAYDAIDKFAWARALANGTGDEVVISEVNWPLKDPGHYTHEFAPYFWHGNPSLNTTVSEEDYGSYMVRYYLLALCSGMVRRVYWWHLASPLFGLVDTTVEGWRARPAHAMLRTLLRHTKGATFVERAPSADDDYVLLFECHGERRRQGPSDPGRVVRERGRRAHRCPAPHRVARLRPRSEIVTSGKIGPGRRKPGATCPPSVFRCARNGSWRSHSGSATSPRRRSRESPARAPGTPVRADAGPPAWPRAGFRGTARSGRTTPVRQPDRAPWNSTKRTNHSGTAA